jgi:hypothetical protein
VRLKAITQALAILNTKYAGKDYSMSLFEFAIKPAFKQSKVIVYNNFDKQDVATIKQICEEVGIAHLDEEEASSYLTLLKQHKELDLDYISNQLLHFSDDFWTKVLVDLCGFSKEIAKIIIGKKETMITQALYDYFRSFSLSTKLAEDISKF